MENDNVREAFDSAACNYDGLRSQVIPHMDIYYRTAVELTMSYDDPKILDLGAGTGILTQLLYDVHGNSQFTLLDLSKQMLDVARSKFKGLDNFQFIEGNYLTRSFEENYDIIISSLSIHHLDDNQKYTLYEKIYEHLDDGGIFINADEVLAPTDTLERMYKDKENGHLMMQDISDEQKEEILYRRTLDRPSTLDDNLRWLSKIGYANVDVIYKYYRYFVLYGQKILK